MKLTGTFLIGASLFLCGCDNPVDAPAPKSDEPHSTVLDSQIQALEKAKQLEGQMQQDEEARRRQMEQATQ